jgi:hypothetical protein
VTANNKSAGQPPYPAGRSFRTQLLPSDLWRRCRPLPCSAGFLPGARRASPVPAQPFPACCRHYPAGSRSGLSEFSAPGTAFRQSLRGSAPGIGSYGALLGVRYLRLTGSLPELSLGLPGGTPPGFRPRRVSPASWPWLLPCWEFHPLGCTAFSGRTMFSNTAGLQTGRC